MRELEKIFREEIVVVSKMAPKKEEEEEPAKTKPKTFETVETLDVAVDDEACDDMSREEWGKLQIYSA